MPHGVLLAPEEGSDHLDETVPNGTDRLDLDRRVDSGTRSFGLT